MSEIPQVMAFGLVAILAIMLRFIHQLNHSWQTIDIHHHVNNFATATSGYDIAKSQGLRVFMEQKHYIIWHKNIRLLLSSIRSTSADV